MPESKPKPNRSNRQRERKTPQRSKAKLDYCPKCHAFVEMTNDHVGNELGEIVCLELGMTVMVFTNEPAARSWLLYGEGPAAGSC